jgi:hypothetical protein
MTTVRAGGGGACGLGVSAGAAAGAAAWGGGCPFFFFFDAPKNPMAHRLLLTGASLRVKPHNEPTPPPLGLRGESALRVVPRCTRHRARRGWFCRWLTMGPESGALH